MTLSVGLVGLPNVGKSTLFNALTQMNVDAENYPFCTIEPHSATVTIEDERLDKLAQYHSSERIIHSTISFMDIAGIVKGASEGEGLGNKFLANIRDASAIIHVVRCFEDTDITHVSGQINPIEDMETIDNELLLADLSHCENIVTKMEKRIRKEPELKEEYNTLQYAVEQLQKGLFISTLSPKQRHLIKQYRFLTDKETLYVANIDDQSLFQQKVPPLAQKVQQVAISRHSSFCAISAKIEHEIALLEPNEKKEFLDEYQLKKTGLSIITKECFKLLKLQSFLTSGPKETRSWTCPINIKAPQAAGVIHNDFERGFIRANVISYTDFEQEGSLKACKEKGRLRQEGKDYIVKDGDIIEFLFNV